MKNMKFKKVEYIPFYSRYVREDGKYTITTATINNKAAYIVTDENGNKIEIMQKMKDAKLKYSQI